MGGWKVNWRCPAIKIKNSEANLKWRSAALQKYVLENGTLVSWILGPTLLAPNSMTWPPSRTTMLLWLCHYHSSCHNMSRQPFLRLMPYPTHPFMRGIPRAILFHVSCSWGGLRKPFLFICLYVCSWRGSPGPFLFMFPAPEDGHHLDTFFIFPPGYVSLMFPTLRRVVGTAPLEGIFHITPHCCWAAGNWTFPWPCFSSFCSPLFSGKKKRARSPALSPFFIYGFCHVQVYAIKPGLQHIGSYTIISWHKHQCKPVLWRKNRHDRPAGSTR